MLEWIQSTKTSRWKLSLLVNEFSFDSTNVFAPKTTEHIKGAWIDFDAKQSVPLLRNML